MPDPIPADILSATADAIRSQPAGSSAAHLARVALEAAAPLLRAADASAGTKAAPGEYGPFNSERQALATRSAALIRAAFDDHPGVGASVPESLKVMTDACEAHGVALGNWDLGFLKGVAWGETADTVSLAGMVTRAYQAGLAAQRPEGTATEWAVSYVHKSALFPQGRKVVQPYPDEDTAREAAAEIRKLAPQDEPRVMSREVGPWTPADLDVR